MARKGQSWKQGPWSFLLPRGPTWMKGWEQECRWGENPEILSVTFSPQPVKTGEWSLFQLVLFNTISLLHAVQIGSCSQEYRRVAWPDLKGASRYLAGNRSGTDPTARAEPWMDQQPRGHLHLFPYSSLMPLLSGAAPQCFLTGISSRVTLCQLSTIAFQDLCYMHDVTSKKAAEHV